VIYNFLLYAAKHRGIYFALFAPCSCVENVCRISCCVKEKMTLNQCSYKKAQKQTKNYSQTFLDPDSAGDEQDESMACCVFSKDLDSEAVLRLAGSRRSAAPKSLHLGPPTSSRCFASSSPSSNPNSRSTAYPDLVEEERCSPNPKKDVHREGARSTAVLRWPPLAEGRTLPPKPAPPASPPPQRH
jgi:hypothetical protein